MILGTKLYTIRLDSTVVKRSSTLSFVCIIRVNKSQNLRCLVTFRRTTIVIWLSPTTFG